MGESWASAGLGLAQGSPGAKKAALAPWAMGKLSQAVTSLIVSDLADSIFTECEGIQTSPDHEKWTILSD